MTKISLEWVHGNKVFYLRFSGRRVNYELTFDFDHLGRLSVISRATTKKLKIEPISSKPGGKMGS